MINQLIKEIQRKDSAIVVGLDPYLDKLPQEILDEAYSKYGETMKGASYAILKFNKEVIDIVKDIVPAVKPQIAFYELYGYEGIKAYQKTIEYAKQNGLIVIGDCKRGDIATTSLAYADAHIGKTKIGNAMFKAFDEDFVTVNPYLGSDGIKPFVKVAKENHKGIFVLLKTSNPSSVELQDQMLNNHRLLYMQLALQLQEYMKEESYSCIGCVVGATYPNEAKEIRKQLKNAFFLVPGYGKQGANGEMIQSCFNEDGLGALVSASRSILYPENDSELPYREAIKEATLKMNEDVNSYRKLKNTD